MEEQFRIEARTAVIGAAERLGVDPYRLARFLSDGRLADILVGLREGVPAPTPETVALAERYLEFLEQEIALQRDPGPVSSKS